MLIITADILQDFVTFGYLTGVESDNDIAKDSLIIITPSSNGKPQAQSTIFPKITDGLSKLYLFNGMQNLEHPNKGMVIINLCYFFLCVSFCPHFVAIFFSCLCFSFEGSPYQSSIPHVLH